MPQEIGSDYKSLVPTFSDDASIEEAFRMYHYGVENYNGTNESANSIQAHFRAINERADDINDRLDNLTLTFIEEESRANDPNVITPENSSTVPLTIRAAVDQAANLQQWQSSAGSNIAAIFSDGATSYSGYLSVGSITKSTTTANAIQIGNSLHRGVTIRGAASQSANLQEWQSNQGIALARVDSAGKMFSKGKEVVNLDEAQTISNKTIINSTVQDSIFTNPIAALTIVQKTANYTFVTADQSKLFEVNSSTAVTLSINTDTIAPMPIGSVIAIMQVGTGQVTIASLNPGITTLVGTPGFKTRAQWSLVSLVKRAANYWVVVGDTVA